MNSMGANYLKSWYLIMTCCQQGGTNFFPLYLSTSPTLLIVFFIFIYFLKFYFINSHVYRTDNDNTGVTTIAPDTKAWV